MELGKLDEAEASYRQAIELEPAQAVVHSNLGITLKKLGRLDEAEQNLKKAIELQPSYAEAYNNLGITLMELGRLDEAEQNLKKAIELQPSHVLAYSNLGVTLKELGRLDEAEQNLKKAIELQPSYAEAYNNLGVAMEEQGRLDEADQNLRKAIQLKPNYAEAYYNLSVILKQLGRLDEAELSLRQSIEQKPSYAEAYRTLSLMKKFESQDELFLKMQELNLDENTTEEERCHINFGLAKACEDLGDFDKAFKHFTEGNALRKKLLNYDIDQDIKLFKQIKSNHQLITKNSLKRDMFEEKFIPIFIVGMPRSGTTLVEQIISSHSEVTGAGELFFISKFGSAIASDFSEKGIEALVSFRKKYFKELRNFSNGKVIVTDKMPQNFLYLGLIAAAFPEAKIIHVKRNPAAVCWANFKQYFDDKDLGYAYTLDDVISYHALYENLMQFWESSLSKRIYNIDYELLTVQQEKETHNLIDYLGLDWDEECLSPQNNKRNIKTASDIQVRKKVYQGSSQQWKRYEPFLNGVFDVLN
jgi:tetratricopeptide (TPR) repeat protein